MLNDKNSEQRYSDISFDDAHLSVFRKSVSANFDPDDVGGKRGRSFGEMLPDVDISILPEGQVKRSKIFELATTAEVNTPTVCAAIMAWGGMRKNHRDLLFKSSDRDWIEVAQDIRCGEISRMIAYDRLRKLKQQGKLKGAGPAYFTKLIYFLTPRKKAVLRPGYIMDQWAGCSINLLVGREVVLMNVTKTWKLQEDCPVPSFAFTVADENTETHYETFCVAVDRLVKCYRINPDQADRALVSTGGRKPESWRQYVMHNRCKGSSD